MHKPWEKNKKEIRRQDERDIYGQDNKKKLKLKPIDKDKYRVKGYNEDSEEE
ncbi:MAG TPA: hypothetical protein PK971_05240 [Saprospiraceae bacterium]|nr:hypothetical protein [Saprospiraceae bacterium]HND87710.1 hypothetical protein [Saprospiraceae bacterium]HNG89078.1 hypothetical protein [Saprospiraceae bacterium]